MQQKPPEVRINFSFVVYDFISRDKYALYGKDWGEMPSMEQCEEWTEHYRQEWAKYSTKVMTALSSMIGANFRQPLINAYTALGVRNMSDPIMINFLGLPDQFVDSLTHELIHVLLTDNEAFSLKGDTHGTDLVEEWQKIYGKHEFDALIHIPLHAIHKYIYLDVLKDKKRLARDIENNKQNKPYREAWDYVEAHDYHKMIKGLKKFYSSIGG